AGVATQALAYLAEGGPANLAELHRFLSDTLLLTGEGFAPPREMPAYGVRAGWAERADHAHRVDRADGAERADRADGVNPADREASRRVDGHAGAPAPPPHTPQAARRPAVVRPHDPTTNARLGSAVGLDTTAAAVVLLRAWRAAGYKASAGFAYGDRAGHSV